MTTVNYGPYAAEFKEEIELENRASLRATLPYGIFKSDIHEVLFSRDYQSLLERKPGEPTITPEAGHGGEVFGAGQSGTIVYLFADATSPFGRKTTRRRKQIERLRAILDEFKAGAFRETGPLQTA
jgi:hypothetical protein